MRKGNIFGAMDEQTFNWLKSCIETAPDNNSLEGIRITIEWFYDIDKDFDSFSLLIELINKKLKIHES